MVDKVGCSNGESLSLAPRPKEKHTLWQVTHYSECDLPLVWRGPSLRGSPQVYVLTLLWEMMATICQKGQTAEISIAWGVRSITVIGIWSQIQIGHMREEQTGVTKSRAWLTGRDWDERKCQDLHVLKWNRTSFWNAFLFIQRSVATWMIQLHVSVCRTWDTFWSVSTHCNHCAVRYHYRDK